MATCPRVSPHRAAAVFRSSVIVVVETRRGAKPKRQAQGARPSPRRKRREGRAVPGRRRRPSPGGEAHGGTRLPRKNVVTDLPSAFLDAETTLPNRDAAARHSRATRAPVTVRTHSILSHPPSRVCVSAAGQHHAECVRYTCTAANVCAIASSSSAPAAARLRRRAHKSR